MRDNNVAQSYVKETKSDVIKLATTAGISIACPPPPPVILFQNKAWFSSIAYIGALY